MMSAEIMSSETRKTVRLVRQASNLNAETRTTSWFSVHGWAALRCACSPRKPKRKVKTRPTHLFLNPCRHAQMPRNRDRRGSTRPKSLFARACNRFQQRLARAGINAAHVKLYILPAIPFSRRSINTKSWIDLQQSRLDALTAPLKQEGDTVNSIALFLALTGFRQLQPKRVFLRRSPIEQTCTLWMSRRSDRRVSGFYRSICFRKSGTSSSRSVRR